jgi:hypothetical protein
MDQINLAVISFDTVQLLIPQESVATIEMIENLETEPDASGAIGRLRSGGREWPVYALNDDLSQRNECSPTSKYCIAFDVDGQPAFSIACDQVSALTVNSTDQIKPLQSFMRNPNSPIEALLLQDGQLMLVSQVDAMHQYLNTEQAA